MFFAESDLAGLRSLASDELSYELCRSKLAEVLEKLLKAELIRRGWFLKKTHDLRRLARELTVRDPVLGLEIRPLCETFAQVYFTDRYPGFDLEDPDWPTLREQLAAVTELATKIRARLP